MTPKEKAKELVQRFIDEAYAETTEQLYTPIAKNAALIAVDEILSNSFLEPQLKRHVGSVEPLPIHLEYWFEVKKEIENL